MYFVWLLCHICACILSQGIIVELRGETYGSVQHHERSGWRGDLPLESLSWCSGRSHTESLHAPPKTKTQIQSHIQIVHTFPYFVFPFGPLCFCPLSVEEGTINLQIAEQHKYVINCRAHLIVNITQNQWCEFTMNNGVVSAFIPLYCCIFLSTRQFNVILL